MPAIVGAAPLVSPGGFVLVDDYGGIEACAAAVDEYRATHGITAPKPPPIFFISTGLNFVPPNGLYWTVTLATSRSSGWGAAR